MGAMGRAARQAAATLRLSDAATRTRALEAMAAAVRRRRRDPGRQRPRCRRRPGREASAPPWSTGCCSTGPASRPWPRSLETVAAIPDPLGGEIGRWERPNGPRHRPRAHPIGVIGIIYESRPNVTADAAALCLRAGNAGDPARRLGSPGARTWRSTPPSSEGSPKPTARRDLRADRAHAGPRRGGPDAGGPGGRARPDHPARRQEPGGRVRDEARGVAVLGHLEGLNHVFLHASADLEKAIAIAVNAKLHAACRCAGRRRPCWWIPRRPQRLLPPVAQALAGAGCEHAATRGPRRHGPRHGAGRSRPTGAPNTWPPILSVAVVDGVERGRPAYRPLRLGPHRRHRGRGRRGRRAVHRRWSTAPSCWSTPRPSSPTEANSASARRSASPPTACMRGPVGAEQPDNLQICGPRDRPDASLRAGARRPRAGFHLAPGMRAWASTAAPSTRPRKGTPTWPRPAKNSLRLDRVIWLVSPQNPLKGPHTRPPNLAERMAGGRGQGRQMIVSDVETRLGL